MPTKKKHLKHYLLIFIEIFDISSLFWLVVCLLKRAWSQLNGDLQCPYIIEPNGKVISSAADVWMLGCITFILDYGYQPFTKREEILSGRVQYPFRGWAVMSDPSDVPDETIRKTNCFFPADNTLKEDTLLGKHVNSGLRFNPLDSIQLMISFISIAHLIYFLKYNFLNLTKKFITSKITKNIYLKNRKIVTIY